MILIMIALILGFVNLVLIYQKAKNILSDWILYIILTKTISYKNV